MTKQDAEILVELRERVRTIKKEAHSKYIDWLANLKTSEADLKQMKQFKQELSNAEFQISNMLRRHNLNCAIGIISKPLRTVLEAFKLR